MELTIVTRRTTNSALAGLLIYYLAGVVLVPTASLGQGPWGPSGVTADSGPADTAALLGCDFKMGLTAGKPILEPGRMGYVATVTRIGCAEAGVSPGTGGGIPDVVVKDVLPAGLTFVSTEGCAEDPMGVPICTLGTVGDMAAYTIDVVVDDDPGDVITNCVTLYFSNPPDTNSDNNVACVTLRSPYVFDDGFETGNLSAWSIVKNPTFLDGFESGDTSAWSSSMP